MSDINNDLVKTFLKELDKLNEEEIKNKISSLTIENEEIVENIEKIEKWNQEKLLDEFIT